MKKFVLLVLLCWCCATIAHAEAVINKTSQGWDLSNGSIRLSLTQKAGVVQVQSLRLEGGKEWAVAGTPLVRTPTTGDDSFRFSGDAIADAAKGGKQLTLHFQSKSGALLSLLLRMQDEGAVIRYALMIENKGAHKPAAQG